MKIKIRMKVIVALVVLMSVLLVFAPAVSVFAATQNITAISSSEAITTTKYEIRDGIIIRITAGTILSQFLANITNNINSPAIVYSGNTKVADSKRMATGMVLKVGKDFSYKIAVQGDASGDGVLTAMDLSKFYLNYTSVKALKSPYLEAVDMNYDGQITSLDLNQLKLLIVGLDVSE
ncbi:MAG: dockerin type I domain-containing protein [Oscillospiraceae bacterium]|nr:dockerin type I domain-containing protein [Oscillospiraceae bacterium]